MFCENLSEEMKGKFKKQAYQEQQYLGVLTGIALKSMSNYINHMNETKVDDTFAVLNGKKISYRKSNQGIPTQLFS